MPSPMHQWTEGCGTSIAVESMHLRIHMFQGSDLFDSLQQRLTSATQDLHIARAANEAYLIQIQQLGQKHGAEVWPRPSSPCLCPCPPLLVGRMPLILHTCVVCGMCEPSVFSASRVALVSKKSCLVPCMCV